MKIFIMRHGDAANNAGEDSLRPLTKQGMFETKKTGLWLARCKPVLTNVFVSPYLRAQQTCANVTGILEKSILFNGASIETLDFITPSGNARYVHDFIDGLQQDIDALDNQKGSGEEQAILLVSHMPFVSYLVAELTNTTQMPIFSTGAIAVIEYNSKRMQGRLVEMVSPAHI